MNKQKLISALQSRVAKRRVKIAYEWFLFHYEGCEFDWDEYDKIGARELAIRLGYEQKVDKALLKMLQSPFNAGYSVGYQDACKAVKLTLEACECQN
jgi:hypothetical protein